MSDDDVLVSDGIPLLAVPRLWVDLSHGQSLGRFVAITDAVLSRRHPRASIDDLQAAHVRFAGGRGSQRRRRALELCDGASESPRESMVRVVLVEAGLPAPECNIDVFDGDRFVARVDMLYRDEKVVVEYDSDYHRDPDQWSRDQIRRAELESLGYRVVTVTRRDFDDTSAIVARVRRVLFSAASGR